MTGTYLGVLAGVGLLSLIHGVLLGRFLVNLREIAARTLAIERKVESAYNPPRPLVIHDFNPETDRLIFKTPKIVYEEDRQRMLANLEAMGYRDSLIVEGGIDVDVLRTT